MQSRTVGLTASRLLLALSLTFAGAGVWAQATKAEDHTAHHPADAASNPKPAPKAVAPKPAEPKPAPAKAQPAAMDQGAMEKMGQMDAKMKAMQDMHEKFMAAKTPEERMALMPEQMKTMQEAMTMMEGMRSGGMGMGMMGDKGGMGMMGSAGKGGMMDKMPMGMSPMHQMMEKRMDMMQSMMQMMMDRMQVPAAK
ncbi:MAG: hypothetical protein U1E84_11640 [Rhodoferax sp.]|mgnify:CR=1 FL=1